MTRLTKLILFMCLLVAEKAHGEVWRYVDIADDRIDLIFDRASGTVSVGHMAIPVHFCKPDEIFFCFTSSAFAFAVPKSIRSSRTPAPVRWNHAGHRYELQGIRNASILGRTMKVYIFDNVDSVPSWRYFFSPLRGLVAIRIKDSNSALLLLEVACGYGASKTCH